jgi:L-fuculose-phosphate aldolase
VNERQAREQVVDHARRLHARGWVANHDGNLTVRLGAGRVLATPTATSKAAVTLESLLVVDDAGEKRAGPGKPFSELGLHLTVYARRAEVRAVVHAHPPCATAIACAGSPLLERVFLAEAVVSLGPRVPTVPFAAPGPAACAALAHLVDEHDAVLLGQHGVLAWGVDVEQAYLRLELVEHLARIAVEAEKLGGVKPLPADVLPALLEARRKAGLGAVAKPAVAAPAPARVVACAPSPTADVPIVAPGGARDLAAIVREELARALSK